MTDWRLLIVLTGLLCSFSLVVAKPKNEIFSTDSEQESEKLNKNKTTAGFSNLPCFMRHLISNPFETKINDIFSCFNDIRVPSGDLTEPESIVKPSKPHDKNIVILKIFTPNKSIFNNEENPGFNMFELPMKPNKNRIIGSNDSAFHHFFPDMFFQIHSKVNQTEKTCCHNKLCSGGPQCNCIVLKSAEQEINREKPRKFELIDKNFLICVLPALLGLVVVVTAVEIIRRHNIMVKQARCYSQFSHVQHC